MYPDECDLVPKLEYAGELSEGNVKFVIQLETVQITAAKKGPRCSSTAIYTISRAELGMYTLTTNRHEEVAMPT